MNISVDEDFARFGSKSYAINKINSVDVRKRRPHGRTGAVICGLISAFFVTAIFSNANPDAQGLEQTSFAIAVIFGALAVWQWRRASIREYQLFLMTSSSEVQAYTTRDQDEVEGLRHQVESAMLQHSRRGSDR